MTATEGEPDVEPTELIEAQSGDGDKVEDAEGGGYIKDLFGDASSVQLQGLVTAGHGFLVRTLTRDASKPIQSTCRYCGDLLPLRPMDDDRNCEFDPMEGCRCSPCETYRLRLAREYLGGPGRPRIKCGRDECRRKHDAERKRRSRALKKRWPEKQHKQAAEAWRSGLGSRHAVFPKTRKPGYHSDPTGDLAVRLADSPRRVRDLYFAEVATEGRRTRPVEPLSGPTASLSVFDEKTLDRAQLYQAQVAPELFPRERRMRIENWSEQDREMYCGGNHSGD